MEKRATLTALLLLALACSSDLETTERVATTAPTTTIASTTTTAATTAPTTTTIASATTTAATTAPTIATPTTAAPTETTVADDPLLTEYLSPTVSGEDPALCQLQIAYDAFERDPVRTGFPRSAGSLQPVGIAKFAQVLVDFPDAPGRLSEVTSAHRDAAAATDYFREVSDGQLEIQWVLTDQFTRVGRPSVDYDPTVGNPGGSTHPFGAVLSQEIIGLVDPELDFTDVVAIFFHIPETTPSDALINRGGWGMLGLIGEGNAVAPDGTRGMFATNEGAIMFAHGAPNTANIRNHFDHILVHEIGHTLGLPDLYTPAAQHAASRSLEDLPMGNWDVMSDYTGAPKSMDAWNLWMLGWIESGAVYCRTAESLAATEVTLQPLALRGVGYRTAIVRINDHLAVVVESRRGLGVDIELGDARGIIVYTVDTSLRTHQGPHRIQLPEGHVLAQHGHIWPNALFGVGDRVLVEGVTIELLQTGDYDRIRISR